MTLILLFSWETHVDIWVQISVGERSGHHLLHDLHLNIRKSANQSGISDLAMHNDLVSYPVWIKTHAALSPHTHTHTHLKVPIKVSDSHTERQTLYCTILTIDFIIIFSSAPASPPLIFTTGTSITLMACKNQPAGSGCQTLAFERRRRKRRVEKKKRERTEMRSKRCFEIKRNRGQIHTN